jgi:hypothetical protein
MNDEIEVIKVVQSKDVVFLCLGKAARINDEKKREDASYFRASAQCNEKQCESEYTFSMLKKPNIEGVGFVEILVNRV